MAESQPASQKQRLVEGNKLRCPHCEQLGDPFYHFKPLQFVEQYQRELNRVLQHRRDRGGCGHVFSPGDPWIIQAYLSGDLVQRELLVQARKQIEELNQELARLRALNNGKVLLEDSQVVN